MRVKIVFLRCVCNSCKVTGVIVGKYHWGRNYYVLSSISFFSFFYLTKTISLLVYIICTTNYLIAILLWMQVGIWLVTLYIIYMYIRVSQNTPFSVKHSMTGRKRMHEWRRVRKYIRFWILFIPRASNCKKPFRGFSDILLHNISYEFT